MTDKLHCSSNTSHQGMGKCCSQKTHEIFSPSQALDYSVYGKSTSDEPH